MLLINDDMGAGGGDEFEELNIGGDDQIDDPQPTGDDEQIEDEDRGDNLPEDFLEVDEDVLASIAGDTDDDAKNKLNGLYRDRRVLQEENEELKRKLELLEKGGDQPAPEPKKEDPPAVPEFDVDKAEEDYAEAILEGNSEKAKEIRKQIREYEAKSIRESIQADENQKKTAAEVETAKATIISAAIKAHPELDKGSDAYNPGRVQAINRLMTGYMVGGDRPDIALEKAIKDFYPESEVKKNPPASEAERKPQEDKRRNADAQSRQPPKLGGAGSSDRATAGGKSIEELSDEEFNNLSDTELRRMRGD